MQIAAPSVEQPTRVWTQSAWRVHALVLLSYAFLALVVTFPLVFHLDNQIIANEFGTVDGYLSIWNVWWTAQAMQGGQSPFFTPLLFHPQGIDIFWLNQAASLPQGLLVLPLTIMVGPLVAYNIAMLASFILGGYTAFLFVRHVLSESRAAFVAGVIFILAPFHMQEVMDAVVDTAAIQWVPLYLLILHLLFERRRWFWVLLAGLLLIWIGWGSWYYCLFCLIYTGMVAGLWALRTETTQDHARPQARRHEDTIHSPVRVILSPRHLVTLSEKAQRHFSVTTFLWGISPVVVWLALMTPRLIHLMQTGDTYLGDAREFNARSSADVITFFLPSPLHPLWGEAVTNFYLGLHPDAMLWNVAFGLIGIALAALGIIRTWRTTWRWLVLLIATMLLAMGEQLRVFGIATGIPLPYALLADLPGIRASHNPNHIVVISILLLGLFAAHGCLVLFQRWPRRRSFIVGTIVCAVLLVDGWAGPMPLFSHPIPAGYAALPAPDGGAILPIPTHLNFARSENLWYQTEHEWPIVGGYTGREPPYPLGRYGPGFRELRYGRHNAEDIVTPGWPEQARQALAAYDIRYIIYHPDTMNDSLPRMRVLMDELGFEATYADPKLEIYPVPQVDAPAPLFYLGRGWGGVENDDEDVWRWMGDEAQVHLFNPDEQPRLVTLALRMESFDHERPLTLRLGENVVGTIPVSRAAMEREVRFILEPGEHVLYLGAPADPAPGDQSRRLSIAFLGIELR